MLLTAGSGLGQTIDLHGRVVDESGSAIEGVNVQLVGNESYTQTDVDGFYAFSGDVSIRVAPIDREAVPGTRGGSLTFDVAGEARTVSVEVLDLRGRHREILRQRFQPGTHCLDLTRLFGNVASGVYMVRVRIGAEEYLHRGISVDRVAQLRLSRTGSRHSLSPAKAAAAAVDSLHFYLRGYENVVHSLTSLVGEVPDIVMRRGIAFEPYFFGSGDIVDLATMDTVHIPLAARIHVVVFPEGYTQDDLDAGEYDSDLAQWWDDVFVLKAPAYFKGAFIVWRYDAPSNEHLTGDGVVDSYFRLPLSGDAMAGSGYEEPAAISWGTMATFPFPPQGYLGAPRARNMVWSYMLYDPDWGRSGYSGMATSFANPDNSSQRVRVSMALGHQHEFMHSLACLADEYYDVDHTPASDYTLRQESRYITNVVSSPACETLPWNHLLAGGEINPDVDSLIGAFGTNGRYHPTLRCLMNGSHDNALLYGGSNNNLRTNTRMCNWCRELCAFRIYERAGVLPDEQTSWDTWVTSYRSAFYAEFGFDVPAVVPQENSDGEPVFFPCEATAAN
jgi:hypothetical protein